MSGIEEIEARIVTHAERYAASVRVANHIQYLLDLIADDERAKESLTDRVRDEQIDVARLEGWSFSRLWAMARGSRDADLGRERAEAYQAVVDLRHTTESLAAHRRDLRALVQRQSEMSDAAEQWRRALEAKADMLVAWDTPSGQQLADLAQQKALLQHEIKEISDADAVAVSAVVAIDQATQLLTDSFNESRWTSYVNETLINPGPPTYDYEQLDQAAAAMAIADRQLRALSWELSQIAGMVPIEVPRISETTFRSSATTSVSAYGPSAGTYDRRTLRSQPWSAIGNELPLKWRTQEALFEQSAHCWRFRSPRSHSLPPKPCQLACCCKSPAT